MFRHLIKFEWAYFTRQPSFYVTTLVLFTLTFLVSAVNSVGMGGGNLFKNGPFNLVLITTFFNLLSMFIVVNYVANSAIRDIDSKMSELIYSKPIHLFTYQLGKLLGSTSIVMFVMAMVPLGMLVGSLMPWVNPERFGPINLSYYFTAYFFFALPTALSLSMIFYSLAVRFKSMMAVYLSAVAIFIGFEVSDGLTGAAGDPRLAAIIDPFAIATFDYITRYWSILDKNTASISFSDVLLQNRLLWIAIGIAFYAVLGRLGTSIQKDAKAKKSQSKRQEAIPLDNAIHHKGKAPNPIKALISRTLFEASHTLFSPAFLILSLMISVTTLSIMDNPPANLISPLWPLSQFLIDHLEQSLSYLIPVVITYYCGEMIWREQQEQFSELVGTLPVSNFILWLSKVIAMLMVVGGLLLFTMVLTIIYQNAAGPNSIELSQYIIRLGLFNLLPWLFLVILAMTLQVMSPNKYVGMLLFVMFLLSEFALDTFGLTSHLYRFAQSPDFVYSDMNGYGRALESHTWFMLYWGALSIAFCVLCYGLWQRGPYQTLENRLLLFKLQIGASGQWLIRVSLSLFVFFGASIFYKTRILNDYVSPSDTIKEQVAYERAYKSFDDDPTPIMTSVKVNADIYPEELEIVAQARFKVKNKSAKVINKFLVTVPQYSVETSVAIEGGKLIGIEGPYRTYWFEFDQPLQPGQSRDGQFSVVIKHRGFIDGDEDISLVNNGTAIDNGSLFPVFGYISQLELIDPIARKEHGLSPPKRENQLEDSRYYQQSMFGRNIDLIDFEAVLSTNIKQTAIAPGYLQKEWVDGVRRYFHYKMDTPMLNFYSIISAELEVYKENYKGVSFEVFLHPEHTMNLPTIMASMKESVDYFSENYSPYQHRQARVIEIPRYRNFAQSFANTIPYPEHGLLTDLRSPETLNTLFDTTAHEVAHQWWAHQVVAADVQGKSVLSETLAEYGALLVSSTRFDEKAINLLSERQLNAYLSGRSREIVEEMPLMRAENQPYIHYNKGHLAMLRLKETMGEQRVNDALKAFLEAYQYATNPYPTTLDLLDYLKDGASEEEQALIDELFAKIVIYDLKLLQANSTEQPDGQFETELLITGGRFEANGEGEEQSLPLEHAIDIVLYASHENDDVRNNNQIVVYQQKHIIKTGENVIRIRTSTSVDSAAIDPKVIYIDKDIRDNKIEITQ
jgi:ABC-2 type transport system permease protein